MAKKTTKKPAKQEVLKPQEDILLEVKELMDTERTTAFFKRYGNFLASCAVAIIVIFAGYEGWKTYDANKREGMGDKFLAAISSGKDIKTSKFSGSASYKQLAEMAKAGQLAKDKKIDKAIAQYEKIWESQSGDAAIRKLAKVKAAILMINDNEIENPAWLNSNDDTIFNSEFNELVAIHALENSNTEKAEKVFKALSENTLTTATVKNRADAYLSQIQNN